MLPFLNLIRFKNLFMVFLMLFLTKYALIHSFVAQPLLTHFQFSVLSLSILLITAAGYLVNDRFDVVADSINKPTKVKSSETFISSNKIWIIYTLLNVIGLILGFFISYSLNVKNYFIIFIGTIVGLFYYSFLLKKIAFLGNVVVAFFVTLSFITIFLFENGHSKSHQNTIDYFQSFFETFTLAEIFIHYILFAFIATIIREIIKDIEDVEGDYKQQMNTIPILFGKAIAKKIAVALSIILLFLVLFTIKNSSDFILLKMYLRIFIFLPLLYFTFKLWNASTKKDFTYLSSLMKVSMFLGIISMLLFYFK